MTKQSNTEDLYNIADVRRVREMLEKEQKGKDKMTDLSIPDKQAVLDHNHDTMYVRGVLHRQSNAALGKIENIWTRYLSYWYPHDLPTFLEQAAEYIRRPDDERWYHPHWVKKINTEFNKLKESDKDKVLELMELDKGKNGAERKKLFQQGILTREYGYDILCDFINQVKDI